jgi:hypothetical protein
MMPRTLPLLVAFVLASPLAGAATFQVTTTADAGNGSLRAAIEAANAAAVGLHTIGFELPANRTISLQSELPHITARSLVIDGAAATGLQIAAPQSGILVLAGGNRLFVLRDLAVGPSNPPDTSGGCLIGGSPDGGLIGSVLITDVIFSSCRASPASPGPGGAAAGGAVLVQDRDLQVTRGIFEDNTAGAPAGFTDFTGYGGALVALGSPSATVRIEDSRFAGNLAWGARGAGEQAAFGGAIVAMGPALRISGTEFLDNQATGNGAGQGRGAHIWSSSESRIDDNLFWQGEGDFGGVVMEADEAGPTVWLRNNSFYRVAAGDGPAVYSNFTEVELRSNSFVGTLSNGNQWSDLRVVAPPGASGLLQLSHNAFQSAEPDSLVPGCAYASSVQLQSAWNLSDRINTGCNISTVAAGSLLLQPPVNLGPGAPAIAPLAGSPAIDAGNAAPADGGSWDRCFFTDARGVRRPQDGNGDGDAICDVGAVEVAPDALFIDGFEP